MSNAVENIKNGKINLFQPRPYKAAIMGGGKRIFFECSGNNII